MKPTLTPPIVRIAVAGKSGAAFGGGVSFTLYGFLHVVFFLLAFFAQSARCFSAALRTAAFFFATAAISAFVGCLRTFADR